MNFSRARLPRTEFRFSDADLAYRDELNVFLDAELPPGWTDRVEGMGRAPSSTKSSPSGGIAKPTHKTLRERIDELTSVGHPDFRVELRKEAERAFGFQAGLAGDGFARLFGLGAWRKRKVRRCGDPPYGGRSR